MKYSEMIKQHNSYITFLEELAWLLIECDIIDKDSMNRLYNEANFIHKYRVEALTCKN